MSLSGCTCFQCVGDCELYCRHYSHSENCWGLWIKASRCLCWVPLLAVVTTDPLQFPLLYMFMAYEVISVTYLLWWFLPVSMPNVNCQAWSDLKHFSKAWLDLIEDKVPANQNWKATASVVTKWHAAIPECYLDAMETMLDYMWKS